jgi:hypothetical protein
MRRDWRKADITATTMISLVNRGLVAIDGKKWKALDCEVQPNTPAETRQTVHKGTP